MKLNEVLSADSTDIDYAVQRIVYINSRLHDIIFRYPRTTRTGLLNSVLDLRNVIARRGHECTLDDIKDALLKHLTARPSLHAKNDKTLLKVNKTDINEIAEQLWELYVTNKEYNRLTQIQDLGLIETTDDEVQYANQRIAYLWANIQDSIRGIPGPPELRKLVRNLVHNWMVHVIEGAFFQDEDTLKTRFLWRLDATGAGDIGDEAVDAICGYLWELNKTIKQNWADRHDFNPILWTESITEMDNSNIWDRKRFRDKWVQLKRLIDANQNPEVSEEEYSVGETNQYTLADVESIGYGTFDSEQTGIRTVSRMFKYWGRHPITLENYGELHAGDEVEVQVVDM